MGKTGQPAWVKRILRLLEQAKAKDLVRFGACGHQYKRLVYGGCGESGA
ncbi:MAG: hypothetical protein HFI28_04080 [Lachnospiraceae bacterium]|nr:hypothetical protein [Lachnospiraceae bacterium]